MLLLLLNLKIISHFCGVSSVIWKMKEQRERRRERREKERTREEGREGERVPSSKTREILHTEMKCGNFKMESVNNNDFFILLSKNLSSHFLDNI